jgi:hypothetical protein
VANACTSCIGALATPFVIAGLDQSDTAMIGACVGAQAGAVIAAGVPMAALLALGSCAKPPPPSPLPPPPPATCPVSEAQDFSAAVTPCADDANACTTCITALATPFVLAGVASSDSATLGACISAQANAMIAAGVSVSALTSLSGCHAPPPPPASRTPPPPMFSSALSASVAACPVSAMLDFTPAVTPCSSPGGAVCADCIAALAAPVIASGVAHADGATIARCFQTHALEMLAVGVKLNTLAAMSSCAPEDYAQPAPAVDLRWQGASVPPAPQVLDVTSPAPPRAARRALASALATALTALALSAGAAAW